MSAQQLEIEVLYSLRCESAESMFDSRGVVSYLSQRVGMTTGRIWFGAGNAINVTLTVKQRRNFLRFLNRYWLKRFLVVDNLHRRGTPALRLSLGPVPGRLVIEVDPLSLFADLLGQVTAWAATNT